MCSHGEGDALPAISCLAVHNLVMVLCDDNKVDALIHNKLYVDVTCLDAGVIKSSMSDWAEYKDDKEVFNDGMLIVQRWSIGF